MSRTAGGQFPIWPNPAWTLEVLAEIELADFISHHPGYERLVGRRDPEPEVSTDAALAQFADDSKPDNGPNARVWQNRERDRAPMKSFQRQEREGPVPFRGRPPGRMSGGCRIGSFIPASEIKTSGIGGPTPGW